LPKGCTGSLSRNCFQSSPENTTNTNGSISPGSGIEGENTNTNGVVSETPSVDDNGQIVSNSNVDGIADPKGNIARGGDSVIGDAPGASIDNNTNESSPTPPGDNANIQDNSSIGHGLSSIDKTLLIAGAIIFVVIIIFWICCVQGRRKNVIIY
jgi:hypothetical protein